MAKKQIEPIFEVDRKYNTIRMHKNKKYSVELVMKKCGVTITSKIFKLEIFKESLAYNTLEASVYCYPKNIKEIGFDTIINRRGTMQRELTIKITPHMTTQNIFDAIAEFVLTTGYS